MNWQNRFGAAAAASAVASAACTFPRTHVVARSAPPTTTYKVHTAEAAAEAAASKSVLAIHSIYEKLSNELPTYQVLPNELPNLAIH